MCKHIPPCPRAAEPDHEAARVVASFPEQGWSLLCNGVVTFDDTGQLMPDGRAIGPHPGQIPRMVGHRRPAFGGGSH
jgi:Family of unknown function (DUF5999)